MVVLNVSKIGLMWMVHLADADADADVHVDVSATSMSSAGMLRHKA
jgi:hypothetical protein